MPTGSKWYHAFMKLFWLGLLMILPAIFVEAYQDQLITTQSANTIAAIGALFAAFAVFGMVVKGFIHRIQSHSRG